MDATAFENHVRSLARLKWKTTGGTENVAGVHIDGVFRVDGTTILIEMTISHETSKVREDITKLSLARTEEIKPQYNVECWMVMLSEPTPNQRLTAKASNVRLVSLTEFSESLLNRSEYRYQRPRHFFGSIGDPSGLAKPDDIVHRPTRITSFQTDKDASLRQIVSWIKQGEIVVLLGDFGAGKSIALREVFKILDDDPAGEFSKFPIALNLREHWGQTSGPEVLLRHAQLINCASHNGLYDAIKEGFSYLLMDGFDEISPQPWAYSHTNLRQIRYKALSAVRDLLEKKHHRSGALITGRTHYFPDFSEMFSALGIREDRAKVLELRELSDDEAQEFLSLHGVKVRVPQWLPKRPLFLTYLAKTGYTDEFEKVQTEADAGQAWTKVVEMVCEREAKVSPAVDCHTVMGILLGRVDIHNTSVISAASQTKPRKFSGVFS
jgi:hypothetical protein